MNRLYFGDNLDVLREHVKDESVDLVYLDPPFNSNAIYNVLFRDRSGKPSASQAEAFRDTWEWGEIAGSAYEDVMRANGDLALVLSGLRRWLGENAVMAYLSMMAVRLIELKRVMKPTASLYLHCDPTASHYLKILLDATFATKRFQNEIKWKRTHAHGDSRTRFANVTDTLLFYGKGDKGTFHRQMVGYSQAYIDKYYRYREADGRRYQLVTLRSPKPRPNLTYDYKGVRPHRNGWAVSREKMEELDRGGRLRFPDEPGQTIREKYYLDEMPGVPITDLWDDIPPVNSQAQERIGYPTQKPLQLLSRIINSSSDPGDLILDPFCGCGTSVEAAEQNGRKWIGIDVTHYAITLIENRLLRAHANADYRVEGRPLDLDGAKDLFRRDPHQFQWWAAWRIGAQSYRESKRGADRGIDGNIFFSNGPYGTGRVIISVKGGENIGPQFVRDLRGTIEREDAEMGVLVTLAEPTRAMVSESAAAGFVTKSAHGRLPRIQIVTVSDFFYGRMPKLPPIPEQQHGAAPRRARAGKQMELLLPISGEKLPIKKGDFVDPRYMELGRPPR